MTRTPLGTNQDIIDLVIKLKIIIHLETKLKSSKVKINRRKADTLVQSIDNQIIYNNNKT